MKKLLLFFSFVFVTALATNAQVIVKGHITEKGQGTGIPGVAILEKGTTNGTVTDFDGDYSLSVSNREATLVISYIGYLTKEINVSTLGRIDVELEVDLQTLEEVVVIGYGEVEKTDVTGAVSTLGDTDFIQGVTTSPQDLLTGKIAGVNITRNTGAPGSGSTIRIRGGSSLGGATNDPLIVIDGFPVDDGDVSGLSNPLNTLNPSDIESFTVLKDASAAAIYGSRASNGVILITTKKGTTDKMKVTFDNQVSISTPTKYVDNLSGDEYRTLVKGLSDNGFSGIDANAIKKLGSENTDWQKEIFRNSVSYATNLSLSGKVKNAPYRVSYGYNDENGILKTTSTKRHTVSLNINPKFFDEHLAVNVNAKGTAANTNFGDPGAVGMAVDYDPTQPVRNGSNKYKGFFAYTSSTLADGSIDPEGPANTFITNPVSMLELRENIADVKRFTGNVQLDYKFHFLEDLKANLNLGMDNTNTDGVDNAKPGTTWTYRDYTGEEGGRLLDYTSKTESKLLEFFLNYNKSFGKHSVDVIGGYSWQHWKRSGTTFDRNTAGDQIIQDSQYMNENYLVSMFGRMIYSFDKRYVVTATVRRDGSSRFAEGNQWGTFPSLAFAWNINNEAFLSNVDQLTSLKLRVGYGITGQQGLSPNVGDPYYPAIPKYRRSIEGAYYQFGNEFYNTLRPSPYDANLKWEETTTINLGVDFGLWDDKLTGTIEGYQKETDDLLNRVPIADGSNFSNYLVTNVGTMEIKGLEVTLMGRLISRNDLTWSLGGNFTYNTREITKLNKVDNPEDPGVPTGAISGGQGNMVQIHSVGQSPNSFYVFQQVYNEAGKPVEGLYANRTGGTGEVGSNEFNKYHANNPNPEFLIGLNTRVSYKNFDFSMSGRWSIGNKVYNNGLANNSLSGLYQSAANGYFTNIRKEAVDIGFVNPQYWSDMYVQDASFFKLDNVSLGYTLTKLFNNKIDARMSFTIQNALVVTDYEGIDPEVGYGIDNNIYPVPRTYQFGLNLNF
ncbi:TonB-dependent receptor [Flammeovirga pectinis]|uniref:TonB-dependent receptor n=1 Tax=Flammeovirga pectinis TaxID=2494373 RepID=A0A3Q9FQQ2_9BACT|nr:TonB-dependent receptor [Flammeovirga pectinis]AZQ64876.1 TonB-dependent receptor [Flammeovirga pectinis]